MSQKLRGLVGQAMRGERRFFHEVVGLYVPTTSSSFVVPKHCDAFIYLLGSGASGNQQTGGSPPGGDGGAGLYKKVRLSQGQTVSYTYPGTGGVGVTDGGGGGGVAGNAGGAATVTLPDGRVLTAGGGQANSAGPGVATGGDVNIDGGANSGMTGGTGAGAALGVYLPGYTFPTGSGGNGSAAGPSSNGAAGAVVIILVRTSQR